MVNIDATSIIVTALGLIGGGGLGSFLGVVFSKKKYEVEAKQLEQQLRDSREEANRKSIDFIQDKMREIASKYEAESEALRKRNEELDHKISDLNSRLQNLMEWVVVDNNQYRTWLETELRKLNPEISFPPCSPAPIKAEDNN